MPLSIYEHRERLKEVHATYNQNLGEFTRIQNDIVTEENLIASSVAEVEMKTKIVALLQTLSEQARQTAKVFIEDLVTNALTFISEKPYKFTIEFSTNKAGKAEAEFYVMEDVNGVLSLQSPQDACGGGFVDIIATALRYAYLEVLNAPMIQGSLLLDEPGKMVSESASIKYGAFIQDLTKAFQRQTIMITHNATLMAAADNTIMVTKDAQSRSVVTAGITYNDLNDMQAEVSTDFLSPDELFSETKEATDV